MRKFEGTKKCAYCGAELTQDEIKEYYPSYRDDFISDEEQCPYCGYHNDLIEEISLEMHYSIIT